MLQFYTVLERNDVQKNIIQHLAAPCLHIQNLAVTVKSLC